MFSVGCFSSSFSAKKRIRTEMDLFLQINISRESRFILCSFCFFFSSSFLCPHPLRLSLSFSLLFTSLISSPLYSLRVCFCARSSLFRSLSSPSVVVCLGRVVFAVLVERVVTAHAVCAMCMRSPASPQLRSVFGIFLFHSFSLCLVFLSCLIFSFDWTLFFIVFLNFSMYENKDH